MPALMAESIEQQLLSLEARLDRARVAGDLAVLDEVLAAEFRTTNPAGVETTREATLADVRRGALRVRRSDSRDITVRPYGDVAVVRGRAHLDATYEGHAIGGVFAYTHVYVLRDGRWQVVAAHTSGLMPAPLYVLALRLGNLVRRLRS
jgi:ketosteroid isomerase-like protein